MMTVVGTQKKRIKGLWQQDCWSSNSCWRRETADAYKEAKDHDQWILKAIQEQIDLVQQDTSDKACYSKMNTILTTDTENGVLRRARREVMRSRDGLMQESSM